MRRADRLFQIVQHLRGGRLVTAQTLAERLEVSRRTIYRDVADLIGSGVPIDGEAGVGYVMRAGYDLPPLMFTEQETVALVAGARLIQAWGGRSMAEGAEEALVKIQAVLSGAARERAETVNVHAIPHGAPTDTERALIDQLESACQSRLRVQMRYADVEGRATDRVVRPLGLWFWGKVWTLVAWCELRDDFRMFRIDRIQSIITTDRFPADRDKSLMAFFAGDCDPTG